MYNVNGDTQAGGLVVSCETTRTCLQDTAANVSSGLPTLPCLGSLASIHRVMIKKPSLRYTTVSPSKQFQRTTKRLKPILFRASLLYLGCFHVADDTQKAKIVLHIDDAHELKAVFGRDSNLGGSYVTRRSVLGTQCVL